MAIQEGSSNISVEEINTAEISTMRRAIHDDLDSNNNIAEVSITIEMGEGLPNKVERLHKVPKMVMKESYLEFFEPTVVSLGPYHRTVKHLQITADKHEIKNYLLQGRNKKAEDFDKDMSDVLKKARALYVKDSMSSKEFNEMMILDACFIIHIMDYIGNMKDEGLVINPRLLPLVLEDVFLLENQVPFAVLEAAMNLLGETPEDMTRKFVLTLSLSEKGFSSCSPLKFNYLHWIIRCILVVPILVMCTVSLPKTVMRLKEQRYTREQKRKLDVNRDQFWKDGKKVHLLQILRAELLSYAEEEKLETLPKLWHASRRATELKATGINFKKGKSQYFSLDDVKFEEGPFFGQLFLPSTNRFTKRRLLNLISYELTSEHCGYGITSYVNFLDDLIDCTEDVKELRSMNILPKGLGSDEEVAEFFNKVGTDLAVKPSAYYEVWKAIESHCQSTWRADIADICHKYFGSHLATFSFLIAVFLFLITLAQAYTTFFNLINNKENHILSVFSYPSSGFPS